MDRYEARYYAKWEAWRVWDTQSNEWLIHSGNTHTVVTHICEYLNNGFDL